MVETTPVPQISDQITVHNNGTKISGKRHRRGMGERVICFPMFERVDDPTRLTFQPKRSIPTPLVPVPVVPVMPLIGIKSN